MKKTNITVAQVPGTLNLARVRFGEAALSPRLQQAVVDFFRNLWKGQVRIRRWVRSNIVEIILRPTFMYCAGFYEITQVCALTSARWFMNDFTAQHT